MCQTQLQRRRLFKPLPLIKTSRTSRTLGSSPIRRHYKISRMLIIKTRFSLFIWILLINTDSLLATHVLIVLLSSCCYIVIIVFLLCCWLFRLCWRNKTYIHFFCFFLNHFFYFFLHFLS